MDPVQYYIQDTYFANLNLLSASSSFALCGEIIRSAEKGINTTQKKHPTETAQNFGLVWKSELLITFTPQVWHERGGFSRCESAELILPFTDA